MCIIVVLLVVHLYVGRLDSVYYCGISGCPPICWTTRVAGCSPITETLYTDVVFLFVCYCAVNT